MSSFQDITNNCATSTNDTDTSIIPNTITTSGLPDDLILFDLDDITKKTTEISNTISGNSVNFIDKTNFKCETIRRKLSLSVFDGCSICVNESDFNKNTITDKFKVNTYNNYEMSFDNINEQYLKLNENAILPITGTKYSAGKDLSSPIDCVIPAHGKKIIMTNLAIAWDNPYYYMQFFSRSGLVHKHHVSCCAGVIDFDYRKNLGVILENHSDVDFIVKAGDRIAQYIYLKIPIISSSTEVTDFEDLETDRDGGFGSTGK
jgi:dUTP pyrophosphatase